MNKIGETTSGPGLLVTTLILLLVASIIYILVYKSEATAETTLDAVSQCPGECMVASKSGYTCAKLGTCPSTSPWCCKPKQGTRDAEKEITPDMLVGTLFNCVDRGGFYCNTALQYADDLVKQGKIVIKSNQIEFSQGNQLGDSIDHSIPFKACGLITGAVVLDEIEVTEIELNNHNGQAGVSFTAVDRQKSESFKDLKSFTKSGDSLCVVFEK